MVYKHEGGAYIRSKVKSIAYCKLGEMPVDFCCIDGFPTELFVHLCRCDALIAYVRAWADFEAMCLARYRL